MSETTLREAIKRLADKWDARSGPFPNGFQYDLPIGEVTGSLRALLAEHPATTAPALADRVCALVGWTGSDDSERGKALTQAWMDWAAENPDLTGREAWPELDDAGIAALAARRDEIRARTLRRIADRERA